MSSEVFVQLGTIIISLVGAVITYIIIPFIKTKITAEQQKNIQFWISVAVSAAEQIYNASGMGKEKKQYVIDFLNNKGIELTPEQLDVLIEAAVYQINFAKSKQ